MLSELMSPARWNGARETQHDQHNARSADRQSREQRDAFIIQRDMLATISRTCIAETAPRELFGVRLQQARS